MQREPNPESSLKCSWEEEIPGYILGELSSRMQAHFEKHLKQCFFCQQQMEEVRSMIEIMQSTPPEFLSHDLTPKLKQKISRKVGTRRVLLSRMMICCVVLCVSSVCFYLFNSHNGSHRGSEKRYLPSNSQVVPSSEVIRQSLCWLARTQDADGSWNMEKWGGQRIYTIGGTGLALLTFLKSDFQQVDLSYRDTIDRALNRLLKQQNQEGRFGPPGSTALYNHGIATIAILEAYAMLKSKPLIEPIDRALDYISSLQSIDGGWGYVYGDFYDPPNISISIWQLYALCRAHSLGWKNTEKSIQRGLIWTTRMIGKKGYVGYRRPSDFPYNPETPTAIGAFILFQAKLGNSFVQQYSKLRQSLQKIARQQGKKIDYYRWYFLIHALYSVFQDSSNSCIANLRKILVENQIKTGHYCGSWNPSDRWGTVGGRVYATALATLSLQGDHQFPKYSMEKKSVVSQQH